MLIVQVDVNAFYLVMDQVFDNGLRHGMEDQMITVGWMSRIPRS